jgi:DNA helicase-2/ATP-dependent DNA helicase PcrA
MKSNFLALNDINSSLFEVAYSAENLFVNKQYHYIPTALRVFTEGVMKEILWEQSDENYDLLKLIRCFDQMNYGDASIVNSAHSLRKKGNDASHFEPRKLTDIELISLFQDAIRLVNFYVKSYLDKKIETFKFNIDSLPEPLFEPVSSENFSRLEKSISKQLEEKIDLFEKDKLRLNRELTLFKGELLKAKKDTSKNNDEKRQLQNNISALEKSYSKQINDINKSNIKNQLTQGVAVENEILTLKNKINLLEKKNQRLNNEKSVFEAKIIDNEVQQTEQDTFKKQIIVDLNSESQASLVANAQALELDEYQQKLINISDGFHFLAAPPGAGKTVILTERLQKAVDRFDSKDIACLTFTTRAANEMAERASGVLGDSTPFIGNFHNLCLDLFRNNTNLDFQLRFSSILPDVYRYEFYSKAMKEVTSNISGVESNKPADSFIKLVEELIKEFGDDLKIEERTKFDRYLFFKLYSYLNILYLTKNDELVSFASQHLKTFLLKGIIAFHKSIFGSHQVINVMRGAECLWTLLVNFIELKQSSKSIDFDDILCLGLIELTDFPQKKRFVQVDEVQDLNAIQWKIIQSLTTTETHLFVVGDKEQSIYSFLGANLKTLETETNKFEQHTLECNYRSNKQIVSLLNSYRENVWSLPSISAKNLNNSELGTMLIKYGSQEIEFDGTCLAIKKVLQDKNRSIGLLLPTNKSVDLFCRYFDQYKLKYFRVSAKDLIQHEIIQDWFSVMRVHKGSGSRIDWYNLIYRFTRNGFKQNNVSLEKVMSLVDELSNNGISINDVISDNLQDNDLFQYRMKRLSDSWNSTSVIIFEASKNNQLTAIKLHNGQVKESFENHIYSDFSDLDKNKTTLNKFFDFIENSQLISHNLNISNAKLCSWVKSIDDYDLERRFNKTTDASQFDSLLLAKYLCPNESSYELEHLLNLYQIEFKDDDALSYIMGTSSLMQVLMEKAKKLIPKVDSIIDEYQSIIFTVKNNLLNINHLLRRYSASGNEVTLSEVLIDWVEYVYEQDNWYSISEQKTLTNDIKNKLVKWLDNHEYRGHIHELFDDLDPKTQQLYTLKESDLIDKDNDKLVISTIHRAKGLEFETVIIPMVTNKHYPGWLPDDTPEAEKAQLIDEKKRLLYVALSRPTNKLIVSYHLKGESNSYTYNTDLYEELAKCWDKFSYKR